MSTSRRARCWARSRVAPGVVRSRATRCPFTLRLSYPNLSQGATDGSLMLRTIKGDLASMTGSLIIPRNSFLSRTHFYRSFVRDSLAGLTFDARSNSFSDQYPRCIFWPLPWITASLSMLQCRWAYETRASCLRRTS